MADVQHSAITDPEIHEPKGASTASADTVYVADGAGSGTWEKVTSDSLNKSSIDTFIQASIDAEDVVAPYKFVATAVIADISTAQSVYVPVPDDCTILGATLVLGGAITTADASISFADGAGNSLGTAVTVAFTSSAAGDIDSFSATTNTALTGPTFVKITTDGASDTAVPLYITLAFEV